MIRIHALYIFMLLFFCQVHFGATAFATEEKKWPDSISEAIAHLLKVSDPDSDLEFSLKKTIPLLSFIADASEPEDIIYTNGDRSNPAAFYRFDLERSLKKVLQYGFNPEISAVLLRPSSVRLSRWSKVQGEKKTLPKLWQYLSDLHSPIIVRGVEHLEITPDTNSETYFSYDLDRTIILFKYKGRKVMISLSDQIDKSKVGKKGLILGPDENWDYVYTDEKGVNKLGLGWVRSHIYESKNIMIFYDNNAEGSSVRCAIFNWIKAGWAGLNMVNSEHIYNGIIRFAKNFKTILESAALPTPNELVHRLDRFEQMPTKELRNRTRLYLESLENRYARSEKKLGALLKDPQYIKKLRREEMVNMLIREYIKVLIGKQPANKANYLLGRLDNTAS
jgi:hypothetical protein